jgi:hypothetical protein
MCLLVWRCHANVYTSDVLQGTAKAKTLLTKAGFLYQQMVVMNLKTVASGWHSFSVDGSAYDTVEKGTQSGKHHSIVSLLMRL